MFFTTDPFPPDEPCFDPESGIVPEPKPKSKPLKFRSDRFAAGSLQSPEAESLGTTTFESVACAQGCLRFRLQDYEGGDSEASIDAEARYQKLMERALGGPVELSAAFRAYSQACENDPEELNETQRTLAQAWVKASERAHGESLSGLVDAHSAWFEVTARKNSQALQASPVEIPVAQAAAIETPEIVSLPMHEVFVEALMLPRPVAACEQAPARTRSRMVEKVPETTPQIALF